MQLDDFTGINIGSLIENKSIVTHFQPIVSLIKKSIIGLEGLSRGICNEGTQLVPPNVLFSLAEEQEMTVDLDRLCREKALDTLKKYFYFLMNTGLDRYLIGPYISLATGNLCSTISCICRDKNGRRFILCIDFNPET